MMQEQDLQELAELVCEDAPVLSLYLHMDRHGRSTDEHKLALRQLLAQAAEQGAASGDIERIERFFEHEFDRQARSVACFSCQPREVLAQLSLAGSGAECSLRGTPALCKAPQRSAGQLRVLRGDHGGPRRCAGHDLPDGRIV